MMERFRVFPMVDVQYSSGRGELLEGEEGTDLYINLELPFLK
jgi:hypothetical protein